VNRFVVISGCSGGGKSTLLAELARRGHATIEEPGRRIVAAELRSGGSALPWVDGTAFASRAFEMALADRERAAHLGGWVFFDRSLVDAAAHLQHLAGSQALAELGRSHPYNRQVFLAPPWPEIYVSDQERRHDFEAAREEYARLLVAYPASGYEVVVLPRTSVTARADFVLATLAKRAS
jgi:predicted ATPase